jgi:hypothetical protein
MIHTWLMIVASVSSESYNDLLKMPEGLFWRVLRKKLQPPYVFFDRFLRAPADFFSVTVSGVILFLSAGR